MKKEITTELEEIKVETTEPQLIDIETFIANTKKHDGKFIDDAIKRKYIPIMEKAEIINDTIFILLAKYDNEDNLIFDEYDLEVNPIMDEVFIKFQIVKEYTNIKCESVDRVKIYDALEESCLLDDIIKEIGKDVYELEDLFYHKKRERIEFLKENKKSSLDMLLDEITTIIKSMEGTLNFKDMITLLPQLAKLGEKGLDQNALVDLIMKNQPKDRLKKTPKKPRAKKVTELKVVEDVGVDGVDETEVE